MPQSVTSAELTVLMDMDHWENVFCGIMRWNIEAEQQHISVKHALGVSQVDYAVLTRMHFYNLQGCLTTLISDDVLKSSADLCKVGARNSTDDCYHLKNNAKGQELIKPFSCFKPLRANAGVICFPKVKFVP